MQPTEAKIYSVYVHAACDVAPGIYPVRFEPAGIEASVRVKDCSGFKLEVTPEQSSCQNEHVLYSVTVRNDADVPRNVSLSTDLNPDAYVLPSSITLLARAQIRPLERQHQYAAATASVPCGCPSGRSGLDATGLDRCSGLHRFPSRRPSPLVLVRRTDCLH